jgi:putative transcriptional regulator
MTDEDTARRVAENPDAAPIMTPAQIRAARAPRPAAERADAGGLRGAHRIPLGTPRDWKQGRREPNAAALAYLRVIEREPEAVERALATSPPPAA